MRISPPGKKQNARPYVKNKVRAKGLVEWLVGSQELQSDKVIAGLAGS
jgi:hypothetical protein